MTIRDELESKSLTELAVLCGRVAQDPTRYTETVAAEAAKLKNEWAFLQTPPDADLNRQRQKESQLAELKKQMVDFLARIL